MKQFFEGLAKFVLGFVFWWLVFATTFGLGALFMERFC